MLNEAVNEQSIAYVKDSLFNFILFHLPGADLSTIDDVIMFYVYSTLEISTQDFYTHMHGKISLFTTSF